MKRLKLAINRADCSIQVTFPASTVHKITKNGKRTIKVKLRFAPTVKIILKKFIKYKCIPKEDW
jgi:hypothetical protein